jgi:hypothetical protein
MTYKVAIGYNNAGGLAEFAVPPRMPGLPEYPRWTTGGDGVIYPDGYAASALIWDYLDPDDFDAILDACGLSLTVVSAPVTIEVPSTVERVFDQYNAVIARANFPTDAQFDRGKYTGPFPFPLTRMVLL